MRAYADSSFLLKLVSPEPDSPDVIAEYRRLGHPALFFTPLHSLEVRNAILQRAFHQRRAQPSSGRSQIARERDSSLSRLEQFITRRALVEVDVDMEETFDRSLALSKAQTERLGTRAIDLLHVASAIVLGSEVFLTSDARQAELAEAAGLKVILSKSY